MSLDLVISANSGCLDAPESSGAASSHLLGLCLVLVVLVVVVVVICILLCFLVGLSFLCVVLLLLLRLLMLAQCLPLLDERICFGNVVGDNYVVKDGASLPLPQIESNETEIGVLTECVVVHELRVRNLFRGPHTLVRGIRDSLDVPITLVSRVVFHWCLPFSPM